MTSMLTKFRFVKFVATFFFASISGPNPSEADAISINYFAEIYWGRILSLSNDGIRFQLDCTGKILKLEWRTFRDPVVVFSQTCHRAEVQQMGGEPPDCGSLGVGKPPFRAFQLTSSDSEGIFLHIAYGQGILTLENTLNITAQKLRAGQYSLWMVCDSKR